MHIHPSSPDSSAPEDEQAAATKIQAGFRGYRVRKQMKQTKKNNCNGLITTNNRNPNSRKGSLEEKSATKIQAGIRGFLVRKKQKVATDAATKIQASFRGFKTRKDMGKKKEFIN